MWALALPLSNTPGTFFGVQIMSRKNFIESVMEQMAFYAFKDNTRVSFPNLRKIAKEIAALAERLYPSDDWQSRYIHWRKGSLSINAPREVWLNALREHVRLRDIDSKYVETLETLFPEIASFGLKEKLGDETAWLVACDWLQEREEEVLACAIRDNLTFAEVTQ